MAIRYDKFKKGDQITWFDDDWAKLADARGRFGDGPFTIEKVIDQHSSNWQGMGHTQHIVLASTPKIKHWSENHRLFSGAFFKLVKTSTPTTTTNVKQESE